ncbi:MAG: nucleotidyltransferase family protein [Nitrososphaerales archaeon]
MQEKVACIILAAGSSTRYGSPKQLARIDSTPLLQKALYAANSSKADYVLIVLGASSSEIVAELDLGRANLVFNKEYSEGLSKSIRTGIANIPGDAEGALLMVGDQPFVTSEILSLMIDRYHADKIKKIVALAYRNDIRNPVLIDKRYFGEIERITGDRGAKEVLLQHINEVQLINVENPKIFLDVDTKDNLASVSKGSLQ